jgi:hypothetical protein
MDFLGTFWGGIVTSILAELFLLLVAFIFIKLRNSSILKSLSASRIFGHGIEYAYTNQDKALVDIKKDIENSNNISIFCIRGRSYIEQDEVLSFILDTHKRIRFLLSNPENPFVVSRATELEKSPEVYKNDLRNNLRQLLDSTIGRQSIEKKVHNEPPVFRLLILDNRLYFSYFTAHSMGSRLVNFRVKPSSEIYKGFKRYYDFLWDNSQDMNQVVNQGDV